MAKFEYDPEKVLASIIEVEKRFPVNEWKINGTSYWPYIRTSLAYIQRFDIEEKDSAELGRRRKKKVVLNYAKTAFTLPVHIGRLISKLKSAHRIFVGAETHRSMVNGKLANRYFDAALTDFNKKKDQTIILDRGTSIDSSGYPNRKSWFSLPSLYVFLEARKRLRIAPKYDYKIELDRYDEFFDYLVANFRNPGKIKTEFNKAAVRKRMISFYDRKEFLKNILKKSKVKQVYFLCYYTSLFYPLIAACNELGIHTVDIQHGGIGKGHWSYDVWSKAPATGYTLLPEFFWSWDQNTANLINAWTTQTQFHRALNFGTPWVNDYAATSSYKPVKSGYILYNMADVSIDDYIAQAIHHFGDDTHWVLRMHPRMMHLRNEVEQQIVKHKLGSNVTIEDSTKVLLIDSLRHCSAFMSVSSGSVIEAIQAGLKPILLPSPGFNYYQGYIDANLVFPLENKNGDLLIDVLQQVLKENKTISNSHSTYRNCFIDFEKAMATKEANQS
jgi:hypothetical protein